MDGLGPESRQDQEEAEGAVKGGGSKGESRKKTAQSPFSKMERARRWKNPETVSEESVTEVFRFLGRKNRTDNP